MHSSEAGRSLQQEGRRLANALGLGLDDDCVQPGEGVDTDAWQREHGGPILNVNTFRRHMRRGCGDNQFRRVAARVPNEAYANACPCRRPWIP